MFWNKFQYLSEINGVKPHAVLKELGISSGSAGNWKKGTIPNGEILKKWLIILMYLLIHYLNLMNQ